MDIEDSQEEGTGNQINHGYGKGAGKFRNDRNSGGKPDIPGEKGKGLSSEKNRTRIKKI
jgi:hypothetical protein